MGLFKSILTELEKSEEKRRYLLSERERKENEKRDILQRGYNQYPTSLDIEYDIMNEKIQGQQLRSRMKQVIYILKMNNADYRLINSLSKRFNDNCFIYEDLLRRYGYNVRQINQYINN